MNILSAKQSSKILYLLVILVVLVLSLYFSTLLQLTSPASNPSSSLKTYTSREYGFSLQYPLSVTHRIVLEKTTNSQSHEYFEINGGVLEIYGVCGREAHPLKTQTLTIAGQSTQKLYEATNSGVIIAIPRPNPHEFLCFNFSLPSDPVKAKSTDVEFDKILGTLKFISPSEMTCGGIANIPCPTNYKCVLSGKYPDASGKCTQ